MINKYLDIILNLEKNINNNLINLLFYKKKLKNVKYKIILII